MQEPTDRDLVLRVRGGETEAFGEMVRRYQVSVYNVCLRMMGERLDAEDLAQESFVRAYQRLESYDEDRPFGPWVRTLAANLCLNQLKRNRPLQVPLDDERDRAARPGRASPERHLEAQEAARDVRRAIHELPPHYRVVIELRHFQELSYAEIAAALDLPLSDVKSHLYRARKTLAQRLGGNE
jgi:RNA polymerase sigma-70 factor (ECF subfamily)